MVSSIPFALNRSGHECFNVIIVGRINVELGLSTRNDLGQASVQALRLFHWHDMWPKEVRERARYNNQSLGLYIKIQ